MDTKTYISASISGRTEFSGINDFLQYVIDTDNEEKLKKQKLKEEQERRGQSSQNLWKWGILKTGQLLVCLFSWTDAQRHE